MEEHMKKLLTLLAFITIQSHASLLLEPDEDQRSLVEMGFLHLMLYVLF